MLTRTNLRFSLTSLALLSSAGCAIAPAEVSTSAADVDPPVDERPLSALQKYEKDFYGAYERSAPEHMVVDEGEAPTELDQALVELEKRRVMGLVGEEAYLRMRQYLLSGGELPSAIFSRNNAPRR